jgi:pyrroline-5-carboxylate reductase
MIVSFIGGGNMAAAMIGGMLQGGFSSGEIRVAEPDDGRAGELRRSFGVATHAQAGEWLTGSDVVVLAVKPQQAHAALAAARAFVGNGVLLSIAAGLRAETLARWLGNENVVRAMPNTPALIRCGISAVVALPGVSEAARGHAVRVLRAIGEVIWLDDEALLDPVTALSGSGPAYVFAFAEAMQRAGCELGLSLDQSRQLILQTFSGAAELAIRSTEPLGVLRERVTSKGGTTAAALASLEADRIDAAIVRAVHAASARARQLGDELDAAND